MSGALPSTPLSARERENSKTDQQRLDDWAYLMTHTIICFLTDPPSLIANNWAEHNIHVTPPWQDGGRLSIDIDLLKPPPDGEPQNLLEAIKETFFNPSELKVWALSEGFGDLFAIPATVAVQRMAPEVMEAVRAPIEWTAGAFYRDSARKATDRWAEKEGISDTSDAYKEHMHAHYESEMGHIAQASMWTGVSMVAGALAQQHLAGHVLGEDAVENKVFVDIIKGSIIGKVITLGTANLPRLLAPDTTRHMDEFIRDKVAKPATHFISNFVTEGTIQESPQQDMQYA